MKRISCVLWLVIGAILFSGCAHMGMTRQGADKRLPDFTLAVAVTKTNNGLVFVSNRHDQSYFHVLLTNHTPAVAKFWDTWNSWGYFCLSFILTDPDGKTLIVRKKDRGWTRNYPAFLTLDPGATLVFEVDLRDDTWEGIPVVPPEGESGHHVEYRVQAVYANKCAGVDKANQIHKNAHGIWTGEMRSELNQIYLWEWDK